MMKRHFRMWGGALHFQFPRQVESVVEEEVFGLVQPQNPNEFDLIRPAVANDR